MRSILIGLVLLTAGLLFVASRQPDVFRVSCNKTFSLPAGEIFPYVNNLSKWDLWSPRAEMDPDAETRLAGPIEGEGAQFFWDRENAGRVHMTIVASFPTELVKFEMQFEKPMAGTSTAEFVFA